MNTTSGGLKVNSKDIQSVSQFTYLASLVTDDNRTDAETKTRFGKAAAAVNRLSKICNNRSFSIHLKMRLYNSIVVPIVLYGAETWAVTKTIEKRMDSLDSRNVRHILKMRWQDKVCTSNVSEKTGQCPLSIILQKRRLTWYGHLTRTKAERLPKQAMNWKLPGKRGCGRPQTTWRQTIWRDLSDLDMSSEEAEAAALDRTKWRKKLFALCATRHKKI